MRGGEKVLAAEGEMLPGADIKTHAYIPSAFGEPSSQKLWGHDVRESFISKLPLGRKHPQAYLPLLPYAARKLNLADYDFILSNESGPIKGINKRADARHVCYCFTPMRYLWDMHEDYYRSAGIGGKAAMKIFTKFLRKEDLKSAEKVDKFVAVSGFIAERIKRIYARESTVVYPPVDVDFFSIPGVLPKDFNFSPKDYYLYAGELRDYKRPDLAVEAAIKMNRNLVVIGNGKLRESLLRRVGERTNVVFLGRVSDAELRGVYSNAKALLFPGVEDFGIVPLEAQAAGTPVVALGKGGALETVASGQTGLFFHEENSNSLCGAVEEFESRTWDGDCCRKNAARFSKDCFLKNMRNACEL